MGVKLRRKLFAIVMTLAMVLSMSSFVFAAEPKSPTAGDNDPAKITAFDTTCTTTTANLTWKGNAAAKTYRVAYKPAGGSYKYINVGSKTSYKITGLKSGGAYVFTVCALNGKGKRSNYYYNTWSYRFLKSASPKATRGKGKITVKWSKVSGASNYTIRYSYNSTLKGAYVKNQTAVSRKISGKKGKAIYYQVRPNKKISGKTYVGIWSGKKSSSAK